MSGDVPKDQKLWNVVFMIVFFALLGISFWGLTDGLDRFRWLYLMTAGDIIIISLATFRVIRLVTFDKIFAFVREWFFVRDAQGMVQKPAGGPRRTVAELIECIWCTGLWAALFVSVLYFATDVTRFFVIILAIAAIATVLQNFSQMITRIGTHNHG